MKKNRRKTRELAVQGLYQWVQTGDAAETIESQLREHEDYPAVYEDHLGGLLRGVTGGAAGLEQQLAPCLDRPVAELSPVERAILLLATFELAHHPEIPYRVVINEAVELAKIYGGSDGYKYVNGVLDKLAAKVRAAEVQAKKGPAA